MSAIRTRHNKTTLLVTKGDNGHFRTLRGITYKKILNKSNAILAVCLHLLATFGLECRAFACKKKYHLQKSGGGKRPPPPPSPLPLPVRRLWLYSCGVLKSATTTRSVTAVHLASVTYKVKHGLLHYTPQIYYTCGKF